MNPEPSAAASSQAPTETAGGTAAAATTTGGSAAIGAPVSLPDAAVDGLPAGDTPNAPGLSPAEEAPNAPGLSPAACGARLAELFPALFAAPAAPGPAKPIKLRIHADIQARAPGVFSKRVLGIFFSRYTTTNAYLKALTLAPHRFDLDGQAAGEISDEHRRLAAEELARRHALAAERRAAQRPPPRPGAPAGEVREVSGPQVASASVAQTGPRIDPRQSPGPDIRRAAPPAQRTREALQQAGRSSDAVPAPGFERPARPVRRGASAREGARPQPSAPPSPPMAQSPGSLPADPALRERVALLRSFEASPLSKANFCALKGITEAAFDEALAQAQSERGVPPGAASRRGGGH